MAGDYRRSSLDCKKSAGWCLCSNAKSVWNGWIWLRGCLWWTERFYVLSGFKRICREKSFKSFSGWKLHSAWYFRKSWWLRSCVQYTSCMVYASHIKSSNLYMGWTRCWLYTTFRWPSVVPDSRKEDYSGRCEICTVLTLSGNTIWSISFIWR